MTERYGTNYYGDKDSEYWKNYSRHRVNNSGPGQNDGGDGVSGSSYGEDHGGYGVNESGYGENYSGYEENNSAHEEIYEEELDEYSEQDYRKNLQEGSSFTVAGVLKCGMAFLILVYIVLLLLYASGSTKPFEEVSAAVEGLLDKESLVKQDAQALKRYYGLNSADYEGVMYYSAEFSISALEVLLIEVETDQQVQEVRDAVEDRLESRKNTFEGYAPEQVQLIEQAQLLVRGRFIFLAVSPDAENYAAAFTNSL